MLESLPRENPKVCVIMPSYNAEKYIAEAIKSVMEQSYKNWKLLILDDGSSDRTVEIARGIADNDSRITVYQNPCNQGVAMTRNRGIELAEGEWIAFIDSDDMWHREKLEKQLEMSEKTGASILYSSYALVTENGEHREDYHVPATTCYEAMLKENVIGCSTVMLRRCAWERHRFPVDLYHEDYALWLKLLKLGYTASGCEEILVDWRVLENARSFNKWSAAKNRWKVYRQMEKLPIGKSLRVFAAYTYSGIAKHKRI